MSKPGGKAKREVTKVKLSNVVLMDRLLLASCKDVHNSELSSLLWSPRVKSCGSLARAVLRERLISLIAEHRRWTGTVLSDSMYHTQGPGLHPQH